MSIQPPATALSPRPPECRIEFEYDWQSRRIRKTVYQGDGSKTPTWTEQSGTAFLSHAWNLLAELDVNAGNAKIRTYVWGNDLSGAQAGQANMQGAGGVGGLLKVANHGDSTQHFVAYDGNGNVMGLVHATDGSLSARYEYDPFGEPFRASVAQAATPFRLSTKYCDAETGLHYCGYRYYDPITGRGPSRDPIGERGALNLCAFTGNSPVNRVDPLGLQMAPPGWRWPPPGTPPFPPAPSPSLGEQFGSIFLSRLLTPIASGARSNHYSLFDERGEMAPALSANLFEVYGKHVCAQRARIKQVWTPLPAHVDDVLSYLRHRVVHADSGTFSLNDPHLLALSGVLEARDCGDCVKYRAIDFTSDWSDDIDVHSFLTSYNDNRGQYGISMGTIEAIWDLAGDTLMDTDFRVTIAFQHQDTDIDKARCAK